MLKKLLVLIALMGVVATPELFAEDSWDMDSYGRVRSTVQYKDQDDGASHYAWYDMTTDAFIGIKATKDVGEGWKSSATIEAELLSADTVVLPQYMYVTLENSYANLSVGRQESSGTKLGGKYMENIDESLSIAETIGTGDFFKLGLNQAGLTFVTGRHAKSDDSGNTVGPRYDESVLGLYYDHNIAETYPIAFSIANIDEAPSKNQSAAIIAQGHGDERYTAYSFSFGVPVSNVEFSFNYDHFHQTHLDSSSTPDVLKNTIVMGFDLDLPYELGYSFLYSSQSIDDGSPALTDYTGYDMTLLWPFKGMNFFGSYSTQITKDADEADTRYILYGAGLAYHFGK
ncbi:MAG: hypothetical protein RRB13_05885 [bacterium]|nr:hypothetical protein [bacterium]